MKLRLIFVGKTKEPYLQRGIEDYLQRLRRLLPVEVMVVRPERLGKKAREEQVIAAESLRVAAVVQSADHLVVLDRRGRQFGSEELAWWWRDLEDKGCPSICFAVGGVLGFSGELLQRAHTVLSLSKMTLTHEMSRLVLLEQLYRAQTILRGEPYHR